MYLADANLFLELLLAQRKADDCERLLEEVRQGKQEIYLTDMTLDSILITMDNKGVKPRAIEEFLVSLSVYRGLRFYFLSIIDRINASRVAGETSLDYEDSALVHASRKLRVEGVISFDKDLDGIKGVQRVEPSEVLNQ